MHKILVAGTMLLISASAGYSADKTADELRKEKLSACLSEAHDSYRHAWADECYRRPGGTFTNAAACDLPRIVAGAITNDLDRARAFCFQISGAGL